MKDFKEIAEKCLAGELKGTFKNRKGDSISSEALCRYSNKTYPYSYYYFHWVGVTIHGDFFKSGKFSEYDIIDFIPDNMQKKIEIDIPEGKVPVMEQTESGVVITWEKELTYNDIFNHLWEQNTQIGLLAPLVENENTNKFKEKANVLCQLTNIRNYFGKPKHLCDGVVIRSINSYCGVETGQFYFDKPDLDSPHEVVFEKREHAEQAIKMLGDELKYLFEPW